MIKLRNDPLDKDQKNELFSTCEDFYKSTQRKVDKNRTFNVFKYVEQSYDGIESSSSSSLNSSFSASSVSFIADDDSGSESGQSVSSTSTNKSVSLVLYYNLNAPLV